MSNYIEKGYKIVQEKQYTIDILSSMAERTIKRLWIIIILLIVLLFGTNAAWIAYESQFQAVDVSQEVEQETSGSGTNNFIGGDYFGTASSSDEG